MIAKLRSCDHVYGLGRDGRGRGEGGMTEESPHGTRGLHTDRCISVTGSGLLL